MRWCSSPYERPYGRLAITSKLSKAWWTHENRPLQRARQRNILKIIEEIKQSKTSHSATGMHSFRNSIMNSNKPHHKEVLSANDFYSSSALRDLLFHTTEHRFNLNQIKDSLELLNLNFCGFENSQILNAFSREYAEVDALYDLKIWDDFESQNPRIFSGMYQFWCQKLEK